jgi:hypothetical protein
MLWMVPTIITLLAILAQVVAPSDAHPLGYLSLPRLGQTLATAGVSLSAWAVYALGLWGFV